MSVVTWLLFCLSASLTSDSFTACRRSLAQFDETAFPFANCNPDYSVNPWRLQYVQQGPVVNLDGDTVDALQVGGGFFLMLRRIVNCASTALMMIITTCTPPQAARGGGAGYVGWGVWGVVCGGRG